MKSRIRRGTVIARCIGSRKVRRSPSAISRNIGDGSRGSTSGAPGERIATVNAAHAANVAASNTSAPGAVNQATSRPPSAGPTIPDADHENTTLLLASTSSSGDTIDGRNEFQAGHQNGPITPNANHRA